MVDMDLDIRKERDRLVTRLHKASRRIAAATDERLAEEDPHALLARYATRLRQATDEKDAAIERYDGEIREYARLIAEVETRLAAARNEEAAAHPDAQAIEPAAEKGRPRASAKPGKARKK
jgi:hypothetical protein